MLDSLAAMKTNYMEDVWIVVPTLNEGKNILTFLDGVSVGMAGIPFHICVVDDGSRDGTLDKVRSFMKSKQFISVSIVNRRKEHSGCQRGAAVLVGLRHGLRNSSCSVYVEIDADMSHSPKELKMGIDAIKARGFNVAIASKYVSGSRVVNRPWTRRFPSFFYNCLLRALISREIRDFSNGYRFYDRESVERICASRIRYGSPICLVETLAILLANNMKIVEFPSIYAGRGRGLSKVRWVDVIKAGVGMLDISIRYHLNLLDVRGEGSH